ncbi:MAG: WG repeat-containing protein, partial [Bacteroidia bacterium]|nr:WG repeat-containing protein [Bacteroidia bacterium]
MSRFLWTWVFVCVAGVCCAEIYDVFEVNGKVGLKDANGKVIIPAEYEALGWSEGAFSTTAGVTGYKLDGKWGLINMSNNRITKPLYTNLLPGEGTHLVAFMKNSGKVNALAGCITTGGKVLIPFAYDGLKISGMRAIAIQKMTNRFAYGLIDLDNRVLIPVIHKNMWPLGSLRFAVENNDGKIALYTEDGRQVVPFTIDRIEPFQKNFAVIHQNGNLGLIDREGKVAVEPVYRELTISADGKVEGRKGDEWIVLDGDNHVLQTLQADSIVGLGEN